MSDTESYDGEESEMKHVYSKITKDQINARGCEKWGDIYFELVCGREQYFPESFIRPLTNITMNDVQLKERHRNLRCGRNSGGMYFAEFNGQDVIVKLKEKNLRREFQLQKEAYKKSPHTILRPIGYIKELGDVPNAIVTPFCQYGDLKTFLRKEGKCPEKVARSALLMLLRCCKGSQRAKIIHGDFSLRNIIINDRGKFLLTDFEHSCQSAKFDRKKRTKLHEMAPETLYGNQIFPESDIWQLGVMAIELLTGKTPFLDNSGTFVHQHSEDFRNSLESGEFWERITISEIKKWRNGENIQSFIYGCLKPSFETRLSLVELERLLLKENPRLLRWLPTEEDQKVDDQTEIPYRGLRTPGLMKDLNPGTEFADFTQDVECKEVKSYKGLNELKNEENINYFIYENEKGARHDVLDFYDTNNKCDMIIHWKEEKASIGRKKKQERVRKFVKEPRENFARKFNPKRILKVNRERSGHVKNLKGVLEFYANQKWIVPESQYKQHELHYKSILPLLMFGEEYKSHNLKLIVLGAASVATGATIVAVGAVVYANIVGSDTSGGSDTICDVAEEGIEPVLDLLG